MSIVVDEKQNEIGQWLHDSDNMQNITFNTTEELNKNYEKSIEIEEEQRNQRLEMTTKYILQTFKVRSECETQRSELTKQSHELRLQEKQVSQNLQEKEVTMQELLATIEDKVKQYVDVASEYFKSQGKQ